MKKICLLLLAVAMIFFVSCDDGTGSGGSSDSDLSSIEDTVFKATTLTQTWDDGTVDDVLAPDVSDMDGDGTDETMTISWYSYLDSETEMSYFGMLITLIDGGTDTTTLPAMFATMGMELDTLSTEAASYALADGTLTSEGDEMTFTISGTTITMTQTDIVDVDDDDEDGDITETYDMYIVLTVTSDFTAAEMIAAAE